MKKAIHISLIIALAFILPVSLTAPAYADFNIGIMQDKRGAAAKFKPLLSYLSKNGVKASFVTARSYPDAAKMFAKGKMDGMFSGSGIAGCLIIKGIAYPTVRPVTKEGWSTYWAVVLAPEGSPRFTQNARYFNDKKVIFCSLASSGEFFFRSIIGKEKVNTIILKASSHGAAIDALSRGAADIAIVKNRVWDNISKKYINIKRVGEDPGENPNMTLVISNKCDPALARKVASLLLGLKNNNSAEAEAVKESLGITGFIKTDKEDFKFTIPLLRKAGVDEEFIFSF